MGPSVEIGDVQEAIHLNRLLRLYPPGAVGGERWELEADPRHVEILVSQMKQSCEYSWCADDWSGRWQGAWCRGLSLLPIVDDAGQVSLSRCELQFAVKERRMQQPNTKNIQTLERLVRFLKGSPRCLVVYNRQAEQPTLDVFSDRRLGRICEDPTVAFVFVRDASWAPPCCVGNNPERGSNKLRRSGDLRVDQECIESSRRSCHGC